MMGERVRTLVSFHLRAWLRSRGPLLWLLFLSAWGWFNWETSGGAESPWWTAWSGLAAWLGFLAGYDTYARMREDGTLRLILLHPPSRTELAGSLWIGSCILVGGALLLFLASIGFLYSVPIEVGTAGAVTLTLLTGTAFASYAQMGSLVLPRDTSAVLGLLVVILGGGPHDRWLPSSAPPWLGEVTRALHLMLPTSNRLNDALARGPAWEAFWVLTAQITFSLIAMTLLLRRRTLTRRPAG